MLDRAIKLSCPGEEHREKLRDILRQTNVLGSFEISTPLNIKQRRVSIEEADL